MLTPAFVSLLSVSSLLTLAEQSRLKIINQLKAN
ncbi:hypothetical protein QUC31_011964 [Theobroma cacao]